MNPLTYPLKLHPRVGVHPLFPSWVLHLPIVTRFLLVKHGLWGPVIPASWMGFYTIIATLSYMKLSKTLLSWGMTIPREEKTMELHSTVIFPVLPGGLHCHILSIWFGSVEGLDRSTPRATWFFDSRNGGWTIHQKMWKLLVALGTMQHTLERRTCFKSPSPTQYLSWIARGQLHTLPLYIYIYIYKLHIWCPNMLNYAVGGFHLPGETRSRVCFWFFGPIIGGPWNFCSVAT